MMEPHLNLCYIGSQQATVIFQTLLSTVLDLQVSMNTLISLEIYILYLSFSLSLKKENSRQSRISKSTRNVGAGNLNLGPYSFIFLPTDSFPQLLLLSFH